MKTEDWKIKNIRMDGLLYRHNIAYELDSRINILGGANGSGKSTILHALAFLLQKILHSGSQKEIDVHCEALYDSIGAELHSGVKLMMKKNVTSSREIIETRNINGFQKDHIRISENLSFVPFIEPEGIKEFPHPKHIIYINSSDLAIRTISQINEKSVPDGRPGKTVLDVLLQDALTARNQIFTARIGNAIQNEDTSEIESLKEKFGRFEKAVRIFMPQYSLKDTSTLTFTPVDDKDTEIIYFRLSTGEKQLLYILLTVSNTMGEDTVLLLDEADTGLHIDWKKILLREILSINPNMQVIAATHSPSLIDGWYDNVREVSQLYIDDETEVTALKNEQLSGQEIYR